MSIILDIHKEFYMDIKTIIKNYEQLILDEVVGILGLLLSEDVFCSIASEEKGVLPHDIANKSIIFID